MKEFLPPEPKEHFVAFNITDVQRLLQESRSAFLPSNESPNETIIDLVQRFAADPEFCILGYEIGGEVASYIMTLSDDKRPDSLAIGPMYVGNEYRGKGIGKKQVEDVVDFAKARGCQTVFTKTWGRNAVSRAIFESLGFEIDSIKENDRADGDSTLKYLLHLQR